MSQHDPVPRLRMKYLVLLGLLMIVFASFILVERASNESRLKIKTYQVETYSLVGDWYRLHNHFARLMLTDTFLVPGIQALSSGLDAFGKTLKTFKTNIIDGLVESPVIKKQLTELVLALQEGQEILNKVSTSYTGLLSQFSSHEYVLYSTMSLQSIQFLYDDSDSPPHSYLQIKKLTSDLSGLDLYFAEVFETKKDSINHAMDTELKRLESGYLITQIIMLMALLVSSIFFIWQIFGINQTLITMVRSRTQDLQETLSKLQDTQNVLLESRRQAGLSSMIMGLAHEINTPLGVAFTAQTAMMDNLESLKEKKEAGTLTMRFFDETMDRQGNLLELGLRNLKRLNEQITYFRTLSSPRDDMTQHLTNLKEDLIPALEQMKAQAARRSLDFRYFLELDKSVCTSTRGILQILSHLFQNSMDHGFPDMMTGVITLRIHSEGEKLLLDFQDTGVGPAQEFRDQILEPFFTTARSKGHMGLGLNIVHNIVYQHFSGIFEFRHPAQGFGVHVVLQLGQHASA